MKITINHQNLKHAIGLTERIVVKNTTLPILNTILLKTDQGRLKIAATNLELGITTSIGAKIDEVGEIAVPARVFSDFINTINEDKITLTTKNNILSISTSQHKTQILGLDPKDFPIIPKIKSDNIITLPSNELHRLIATTLDSTALSEQRPELSGVYFQVTNNQVICASTDGFRLTEVITPVKTSIPSQVIIPRSTCAELIRICSDQTSTIAIKYADNQISFSTPDWELISRVIDGNYPDYKRVIPGKVLSTLSLKKDDFEKSIRVAGLFSSHTSDITLSCDGGVCRIIAKNSDRGENETTIPLAIKSQPFDISLNYRYLLDGLKHITTPEVSVSFTGTGSPLIINPTKEKNFVYIIMPLRS